MFLITTNLFFLASMVVFNMNPLFTWPLYALFLLIDGAYLSANLFKFLTGVLHTPSGTSLEVLGLGHLPADFQAMVHNQCVDASWSCQDSAQLNQCTVQTCLLLMWSCRCAATAHVFAECSASIRGPQVKNCLLWPELLQADKADTAGPQQPDWCAGGWFPIALSIVVFIVSAIWFYGRQRKNTYAKAHAQHLESVLHPPVDGWVCCQCLCLPLLQGLLSSDVASWTMILHDPPSGPSPDHLSASLPLAAHMCQGVAKKQNASLRSSPIQLLMQTCYLCLTLAVRSAACGVNVSNFPRQSCR